MLRKYFYAKMLELYLCYRGAQLSAADAYSNDNENLEKFYESNCRELLAQIKTVKNIAVDLIGKENAINIKHEARKDAQMLFNNQVYWIPTESSELSEYAKRYTDNENVSEIFKKITE